MREGLPSDAVDSWWMPARSYHQRTGLEASPTWLAVARATQGPSSVKRLGSLLLPLVALVGLATHASPAAGATLTDPADTLRINAVDGTAFPVVKLDVTPPRMLSLLGLDAADFTVGSAPTRPVVLVVSGQQIAVVPGALKKAAKGTPLYIAARNTRAPTALRDVAAASGGRAIVVGRPSELIGVIDQVSADLGSQYQISFRSTLDAPGRTMVTVARDDTRAEVTVDVAEGKQPSSFGPEPVPSRASTPIPSPSAARPSSESILPWVVGAVIAIVAALTLVPIRRRRRVPAATPPGPALGLPTSTHFEPETEHRAAEADPPAPPRATSPPEPVAASSTTNGPPPELAPEAPAALAMPKTGIDRTGLNQPAEVLHPSPRPAPLAPAADNGGVGGVVHLTESASFTPVREFLAAAAKADAALRRLESEIQRLPASFPFDGFVLREVASSASVDEPRVSMRRAFRDLAGVGGDGEFLSFIQTRLTMAHDGFQAAAQGRFDIALLAELAGRLQEERAPSDHLPESDHLLEHLGASTAGGPAARAALAFQAVEASWPGPAGRGPLGRLALLLSLARDGALSKPVLDTSVRLAASVTDRNSAGETARSGSSDRMYAAVEAIAERSDHTTARLRELNALRETWVEALTIGRASRAPELVDILIANPIVSTLQVMGVIDVSNQGALNLIRRFEAKRWLHTIGTFGRGGRKYWVAPSVLALLEADRVVPDDRFDRGLLTHPARTPS